MSAEIAELAKVIAAQGHASTEPRFCERGNNESADQMAGIAMRFNGAALL